MQQLLTAVKPVEFELVDDIIPLNMERIQALTTARTFENENQKSIYLCQNDKQAPPLRIMNEIA